MKINSLGVSVALLIGVSSAASASWVLVDNMEGHALGNLAGQSDWVEYVNGTGQAADVIVDTTDSLNKVLAMTKGSADIGGDDLVTLGLNLPAALAENDTGTLYFRYYATGAKSSLGFGLSEKTSDSYNSSGSWNDFSSFGLFTGGDAVYRSSTGNSTIADVTIAENTWYEVWVVSDSDNDTTEIRWQAEGEAAVDAPQGVFRLDNDIGLSSIMLRNNGPDASYVDDIYYDNGAVNTTSAVPEPSAALLIGLSGCAFITRRKVRS